VEVIIRDRVEATKPCVWAGAGVTDAFKEEIEEEVAEEVEEEEAARVDEEITDDECSKAEAAEADACKVGLAPAAAAAEMAGSVETELGAVAGTVVEVKATPQASAMTASQSLAVSVFLTTEPQGSVFIIAPVQPHLLWHLDTQSAALKFFFAHAGPASVAGMAERARLKERNKASRAIWKE